ncbi:MAG: hypothetical protein QM473_01695 [Acidobacteriota bacterium]|nr:hypothetical protein [Acidobacteriota bacterium]
MSWQTHLVRAWLHRSPEAEANLLELARASRSVGSLAGRLHEEVRLEFYRVILEGTEWDTLAQELAQVQDT